VRLINDMDAAARGHYSKPIVFRNDWTKRPLYQSDRPDCGRVPFGRQFTVGLHHLALAVADRVGLDAVYERVAGWPGVAVEFAPEPSGQGPKIHFIVREPSGIRIEFAFDPCIDRSPGVDKPSA
jgi:catechol 2,3-dioxygenase-like lactoylglutathione lyase family enzyme